VSDVDLPFQATELQKFPSDFRNDFATEVAGDLYVFSKRIIGFKDMTERCHGPMCVFLDQNPAQIKACGMPRATFKTSVGTIARGLQRVIKNPNRTQAIWNESATNSQKFLRSIKHHAESNKVVRTLYSNVIPRDTRKVSWNDTELEFVRETNVPEASITAMGVTSTVTSQHWDDITFDDIISEEAAASDKVMAEATERARKFRPLFVHPELSTLTINFTRWGFADSYSVLFREIGSAMALLLRGAIENGESIFPERLSLSTLAQIRRELGEYMFSCLYMNNPRNAAVQDFNIDDLRFFDLREIDGQQVVILFDGEGREFRRYYLDQLEIYATVDLAGAEKVTSDSNAVTVCGITPTGEALVLSSWAKRCTPIDLMKHIFSMHRRFRPKVWGIEDVAYQKAFKYFVKDYAEREDLYLNVKPITALGKKETRIRGLQPIAATHRLYILPTQHTLRNELADFPLGEHDDAADSLSMQLQLWENQMSPARWKRYREVSNEIIRQIEVEHEVSSGRYLTAGDVPDPEDNQDLVQSTGDIEEYYFPAA
jgi:predicted phage terminase large subunit-like protein